MGRLPYKKSEKAFSNMRRADDEFKIIHGYIPYMFKTLAHASDLMTASYDYFKTILKTGAVNIKLKELLTMRVSQIQQGHSSLASHTLLDRRYSVTDEQITTMQNLSDHHHLFTEAEIVALEFAEQFSQDVHAVSDTIFQHLRAFFSAAAIVEISCVIGLFCYFNCFNNALQTNITR